MQVAPLGYRAVHDTPTAGGFLGLRIGSPDFGVSPEVGVYYKGQPEKEFRHRRVAVENDLGVPVVHPVAARVWLVQKKLRVKNPIKGASRLLEELP